MAAIIFGLILGALYFEIGKQNSIKVFSPKKQKNGSLTFTIIGSYLFRFLSVFAAVAFLNSFYLKKDLYAMLFSLVFIHIVLSGFEMGKILVSDLRARNNYLTSEFAQK